MPKPAWSGGVASPLACLALLLASGCMGMPNAPPSRAVSQPQRQSPQYQQPVNLNSVHGWDQAKQLVDQAVTAAKAGQTSQAFNLINQARGALVAEGRQIATSDPTLQSLRKKFDDSIVTISQTTENGREVVTILASQLQDAIQSIAQQAGIAKH